MKRLGGHEELGVDTPVTVDSNRPKGCPYHMASCSTCKAEGRKVRGGTFRLMAFCLPNHHYVWWSPAFLGRGDHLLPLGTWKWFSKPLFYFSDAIFVWLLVYLFSWLYFFHFLPPLHWQGVSCCGSLSFWQGLNQEKHTNLDIQRMETKSPWLRKIIQVQFLALIFSCKIWKTSCHRE